MFKKLLLTAVSAMAINSVMASKTIDEQVTYFKSRGFSNQKIQDILFGVNNVTSLTNLEKAIKSAPENAALEGGFIKALMRHADNKATDDAKEAEMIHLMSYAASNANSDAQACNIITSQAASFSAKLKYDATNVIAQFEKRLAKVKAIEPALFAKIFTAERTEAAKTAFIEATIDLHRKNISNKEQIFKDHPKAVTDEERTIYENAANLSTFQKKYEDMTKGALVQKNLFVTINKISLKARTDEQKKAFNKASNAYTINGVKVDSETQFDKLLQITQDNATKAAVELRTLLLVPGNPDVVKKVQDNIDAALVLQGEINDLKIFRDALVALLP